VRAAWIDGLVAECDMTFHSGALQRAVLKPAACRANGAATFSLGATGGTRTFLALSDGVAGFQAVNDAIVEISGFSGSLAALAIV
jgi:endoglucanase